MQIRITVYFYAGICYSLLYNITFHSLEKKQEKSKINQEGVRFQAALSHNLLLLNVYHFT
jgi:hypothetical protein